MSNIYTVYTDGSSLNNPGYGGSAAIIINKKTEEILELVQSKEKATNNYMELLAVILALKSLPQDSIITLYSDSKYVINCASGLWKPKNNLELWKEYKALTKDKEINFVWVKGHFTNILNNRCDSLAKKAALELQHKDKNV